MDFRSSRTSLEIFRFLIVGLVNTVITVLIIFFAKYFFGWSDVAANVLGYVFGLFNSFVANFRWTFQFSGAVGGAVARFLLAFLVSYIANLVAVILLLQIDGMNEYFAHAAGMPVYTIIFFMISKIYVFKSVKSDCNQSGKS